MIFWVHIVNVNRKIQLKFDVASITSKEQFRQLKSIKTNLLYTIFHKTDDDAKALVQARLSAKQ
ncbi:MAG TPA: hypothetical protein DCW31_03735 [Lactobacillus sp.]|nr:hypothetical protein [Lactobacillus sp.]